MLSLHREAVYKPVAFMSCRVTKAANLLAIVLSSWGQYSCQATTPEGNTQILLIYQAVVSAGSLPCC